MKVDKTLTLPTSSPGPASTPSKTLPQEPTPASTNPTRPVTSSQANLRRQTSTLSSEASSSTLLLKTVPLKSVLKDSSPPGHPSNRPQGAVALKRATAKAPRARPARSVASPLQLECARAKTHCKTSSGRSLRQRKHNATSNLPTSQGVQRTTMIPSRIPNNQNLNMQATLNPKQTSSSGLSPTTQRGERERCETKLRPDEIKARTQRTSECQDGRSLLERDDAGYRK